METHSSCRLIPAGTGFTKIKWQKTADDRDAATVQQTPEETEEKQLPAS